MKVSDEERRRVATMLRRMADEGGSDGVFVYELLCALRVGLPDSGDLEFCNSDDVLRLADLVDRPKCRPITVPFGPCGDTSTGCSVCGQPLVLNPFGGKGNRFYRRCIHCGAEVIE